MGLLNNDLNRPQEITDCVGKTGMCSFVTDPKDNKLYKDIELFKDTNINDCVGKKDITDCVGKVGLCSFVTDPKDNKLYKDIELFKDERPTNIKEWEEFLASPDKSDYRKFLTNTDKLDSVSNTKENCCGGDGSNKINDSNFKENLEEDSSINNESNNEIIARGMITILNKLEKIELLLNKN